MTQAPRINVELPDQLLEQIARRAAAIAAEHLGRAPAPKQDGYLPPAGAARYLGVSRRRIYDLTSARQLHPDGHDGRTPLFTRATLDAYVHGRLGNP